MTELRRRSGATEDLGWLSVAVGPHPWVDAGLSRHELVERKHRLQNGEDGIGAARAAGLLAAEAQTRAARVVERWTGRIDHQTGLLSRDLNTAEQIWDYANAGADLYPHLLIGAALLKPDAYPALLDVLTAERRLARPGGMPSDVDLTTNLVREGASRSDEIYGTVEYAKDALLPLTERLGRGPWLNRMEELARAVSKSERVSTRFGRIPSNQSEVNGQLLQVLSRLYWATGDPQYREAADRIARAYLELVLPGSNWIPLQTWDFERNRSDSDQLQLRDHGNEIVTGLVEYHLIETVQGSPLAQQHQVGIRAMLDRLLQVGRNPDGLWYSAVDEDTGAPLPLFDERTVRPPDLRAAGAEREVEVELTLSDNWGYLYAGYLTQAMIEENWPGGDLEAARRYRSAAAAGLEAAARLELFPWEGAEQDGYADTIEGAIYLLNVLDSPAAAAWVDRQAATLFGAQNEDGRIDDRHLDGNFVRTALLYSAWQSHGARLEPWEPGAMLGASREGTCLGVAVASGGDWQGRVIFDTARHRLNLGLPLNYPRLNAWPEWFVVESGRKYLVDDSQSGASGVYDGAALSQGLELQLTAGAERWLRVCPAAD